MEKICLEGCNRHYTRLDFREFCRDQVFLGKKRVEIWGAVPQLFIDHHGYQDAEKMIDEQGVSTQPVVIEDDVWVGANSVILPGVTLGKHCVVAAGSVVSHSVPPYSICAGCPARIIKTYDFETKEWKKVEKTPATNHK